MRKVAISGLKGVGGIPEMLEAAMKQAEKDGLPSFYGPEKIERVLSRVRCRTRPTAMGRSLEVIEIKLRRRKKAMYTGQLGYTTLYSLSDMDGQTEALYFKDTDIVYVTINSTDRRGFWEMTRDMGWLT